MLDGRRRQMDDSAGTDHEEAAYLGPGVLGRASEAEHDVAIGIAKR
jgi:hypothetical protein